MFSQDFINCCGAGIIYWMHGIDEAKFKKELAKHESDLRHRCFYGLAVCILNGTQDQTAGVWMRETGWVRCNEEPINNPSHASPGLLLYYKDINNVEKVREKKVEGKTFG